MSDEKDEEDTVLLQFFLSRILEEVQLNAPCPCRRGVRRAKALTRSAERSDTFLRAVSPHAGTSTFISLAELSTVRGRAVLRTRGGGTRDPAFDDGTTERTRVGRACRRRGRNQCQ
jgi:hypothetical protein